MECIYGSCNYIILFSRNRMKLSSSENLYLLINNRSMASLSTPMSQIYEKEKDDDGFLYIVYASQEFFG